MNFWYNKTIYKTIKSEYKNEIGQLIDNFVKDDFFMGDIQPVDEKSYRYTWGEDIKSSIQMFCDENLLVNDILVNDNKAYKIEKKIAWDNYYIYALLESEVVINEKS